MEPVTTLSMGIQPYPNHIHKIAWYELVTRLASTELVPILNVAIILGLLHFEVLPHHLFIYLQTWLSLIVEVKLCQIIYTSPL